MEDDEKQEEMYAVNQSILDLKDWPNVKSGYGDLLFFLFFVVLFCVILGLQRNISQTFLIQQALKNVVVNEQISSGIRTPAQFWDFVLGTPGSEGLLDRVFKSEWYNSQRFTSEEAGYILDYNRLVGGVLFLQTRSANGTCDGLGQYQQFYPVCWVLPTSSVESFGDGGPGFTYSADFGGFTRLLSVANGKEQNKDLVRDMKSKLWLDKETRKIEIKFSMYNGHTKAFTFVNQRFDYQAGGIFVDNTLEIQTVKMEPYSVTQDFIQLALELLFVFIVGWNVGLEMEDFIHTVKEFGVAGYFSSLGNYLDIGNIILFVIGIVLRTTLVFEVYNHAFEVPTNEYKVFLEQAASKQQQQTFVNSFNILFCLLRLFKYYQFQDRLNILTRTFAQAWEDLYHFVMMFGVIFVGYAFLGNLLFGQHLLEYSSINNSFQTLWAMLLGDISYGSMSAVNPLMAAIFFWSYAFFVTIVLINVLLAILIDAYSKAMGEKESPRSVSQEIAQLITRAFNRIRMGKKLDECPDDRIVQKLQFFAENNRHFVLLRDLQAGLEMSDEEMDILKAKVSCLKQASDEELEEWETQHGTIVDRSPFFG